MPIGIWIRAVRAPFFTATAVPVILGTAIAFSQTHMFDLPTFLLTLFGVLFMHTGTNLANDYFDHKSGNDEANTTPTPFSGGSRVIQEGLITADKILFAAIVSFAIGGAIGIYLYSIFGHVILVLGLIGGFVGFFYTAPPFKLGYRGAGEVIVGLGFGTLIMLGASYVQNGGVVTGEVLLVSVPIATLIALVLLINEFPDYEADNSVNKKTLVVLLGKDKAAGVYRTSIVFTYIWVALMIVFQVVPLFALLTFVTIPLALKAMKVTREHSNEINELLPANSSTVKLHLLFGLLFAIGYLLSAFF